jgi:predicted dehydrogenase
MGFLHAAIFNKLDGCRLAAICDTQSHVLKFIKNGRDDIKIFTDYRTMLDTTDIDVVVITTPVFLHEPMAALALRSGRHVMIEKPMAKTVEECSTLIGISNSRKCLVGYCRRYMPTYGKARELVSSEELGEVISFRCHYLLTHLEKVSNGWQYNPEKSGGGALMDLGCHAIDMIHYVLGPIDSVSCKVQRVISETVEDIARLDLTMRTGQKGDLVVSWIEPGYRLPELLLEISCERGIIRVAEKYLETISLDGCTVTKYKQTFHDQIPFNIGGKEYTAEDMDLIRSINNNTDTGCNMRAGSMPNFVIESAYASARSGQEKKVNYQ